MRRPLFDGRSTRYFVAVIPVRFPIPPKTELKERYDVVAPAYHRILERTGERVTRLLQDRGLKFSVRHRVKDFDSYYKKLIRRSREAGTYGDARESAAPVITDLLGLRVVCHFLEDLDAARDAVEELFDVIESELKGSEYSSREFGYQSVHYLVRLPEELWAADVDEWSDPPIAEIQLRTILQDAWAEVEHEILYKAEFTPLDEPLRRKLAALNANLTLSDIMFQELREYQRELHNALTRRRKEFERQIDAPNGGTVRANAAAASNSSDHHATVRGNGSGSLGVNHRETLDNLLLEALTAHNEGELDRALSTYSHILETDVSNAVRSVILIHRGMAYVSKNSIDQAIADFDEAHGLDPTNARPQHLRAAAHRARGRLTEAARDIEEAVRLDPFYLDAWILGAQIAIDDGDQERAKIYCGRAAELAPEDERVARLMDCTS